METPGRSSSVPAIKRRHVEILSPDKDQILANMIVDFQTSDFPPYLKLILDALVDTREQLKSVKELCDKINEENVALRSENLKLRQLLQSQDSHVNPHVSSSPAQSSQTPPVVSPPSYNQEQDLERARSIVLSGVPESSSMSAIERASNDLKFVHSVLDHLNVECLPCAVYRMGKPDVNILVSLKLFCLHLGFNRSRLSVLPACVPSLVRASTLGLPLQRRKGNVSVKNDWPR